MRHYFELTERIAVMDSGLWRRSISIRLTSRFQEVDTPKADEMKLSELYTELDKLTWQIVAVGIQLRNTPHSEDQHCELSNANDSLVKRFKEVSYQINDIRNSH
jgi:hypothetical protein